MAILFFIGIVCVIFVMAVDASEANYKKKLEEKRRIYSRQLSTAEDEIVKKMKERYDLISSEEQFRKNSVIHTVEKAGIYSVDLKRIYEPQSIDIWTNQENLCILTSWNFLKSQADSFKDFQATLVGLEYEYVEKELKKRLTTSERYLIHHYAIPLEKIEYFLTEGDIYTSTNVYGGGGTSGGSSVKGAVVGGVLGGSTGAIIGSRKESTIVLHFHTAKDCNREIYSPYQLLLFGTVFRNNFLYIVLENLNAVCPPLVRKMRYFAGTCSYFGIHLSRCSSSFE